MCILNCWFADYRCIRTFNCVTRSRYFVFNRFGHRVFCSTIGGIAYKYASIVSLDSRFFFLFREKKKKKKKKNQAFNVENLILKPVKLLYSNRPIESKRSLEFRTQLKKNLAAPCYLKFLVRHVCPSKRKLARTIEDGHVSEDRTTFPRDVVLDHFWSIETRRSLRRKLALSHASSLPLSLSLCTRATGSRFSRLRRTTSTCRNPRSFRPRNERCACAGFLLPFIVGKNLSFTDKVSWFNGTPLMRDILVDREISTTWSLGELPWGEHAVCPVRFFSFLLSFSHSVW